MRRGTSRPGVRRLRATASGCARSRRHPAARRRHRRRQPALGPVVRRGQPHRARSGADNVVRLLEWCEEVGVGVVTLWLLSTDNLNRDEKELRPLIGVEKPHPMRPWEQVREGAFVAGEEAGEGEESRNNASSFSRAAGGKSSFFNSAAGPHGPSGPVCSRQNLSLSLRNLPQRKTRCWRADTAEGDSRSGRACRQETHSLVATALR